MAMTKSMQVLLRLSEVDLEKVEKAVAWTLALHVNNRDWTIYPGVERIALQAGISERSVPRVTRRLQEVGLILCLDPATGRPGKAHRYIFDLRRLDQLRAETLARWPRSYVSRDDLPPLTADTVAGLYDETADTVAVLEGETGDAVSERDDTVTSRGDAVSAEMSMEQKMELRRKDTPSGPPKGGGARERTNTWVLSRDLRIQSLRKFPNGVEFIDREVRTFVHSLREAGQAQPDTDWDGAWIAHWEQVINPSFSKDLDDEIPF